jgi:hypothetical protein
MEERVRGIQVGLQVSPLFANYLTNLTIHLGMSKAEIIRRGVELLGDKYQFPYTKDNYQEVHTEVK